MVSLESSIQALPNHDSLILAFGGVFVLESFEAPPITENLYFRGNIDMAIYGYEKNGNDELIPKLSKK